MTARRGDDGSVLVLSLIVLSVLGLIVAALLSFVDTSFRTTYTVRSVVGEQYAAEAAVDQRVTAMRNDPTVGRQGVGCPDFTPSPLNGTSVTVTCTPSAGSGAPAGGSGTNAANRPGQAILTLGSGSEAGVRQRSNSGLLVHGDVLSRGTISNTASSAVLTVEGAVRSKSGCSGTVVSTAVPPVVDCAYSGPVVDPGYAVPAPLPAYAATPSCPAGSYVALSPGYYDDSVPLSQLTSASCPGKVVHLLPGAYYFNFQDTASTWTINNKGSRVVGGSPLGWSPASATSTSVPFPDGCDIGGGGVVIMLGGSSRIELAAGTLELCPPPNTNAQRFSLYGLRSGAAAPSSATAKASTASASPTTPTFVNPAKAKDLGDGDAVLTATGSKQAATLTLDGFGLQNVIPAGSQVTAVTLRARYSLTNSAKVDKLKATVAPGTGTAFTVTDVNGCPAGSLCRGADGTYDLNLDASSAFPKEPWAQTVERLTGARVDFDAQVSKSGQTAGSVAVDALQLLVTYVPPALVAQSGCLTVTPYGANGTCALLRTTGNQSDLQLHGTVYAPLAPLDIELTNSSAQVLGRGALVRTLEIAITPSCLLCPTAATIQLPDDSGATADRDVVLTAVIGGQVRLREQVHFDDATSPGSSAVVRQWSVTR